MHLRERARILRLRWQLGVKGSGQECPIYTAAIGVCRWCETGSPLRIGLQERGRSSLRWLALRYRDVSHAGELQDLLHGDAGHRHCAFLRLFINKLRPEHSETRQWQHRV